jgi:hypothetical protein
MLLADSPAGSSLPQKVTYLNYLMKVHFNVILPTLYQLDIVSVTKMDLYILGVYGNGVLKKILDLRAME